LPEVGAPDPEGVGVSEATELVKLLRREARLLASEAREELTDEAFEASELEADERAESAELAALEAALAALETILLAALAALEVMLLASLARELAELPALSVAEAKADDKTPRAPVEMAVADALADSAMEAQ